MPGSTEYTLIEKVKEKNLEPIEGSVLYEPYQRYISSSKVFEERWGIGRSFVPVVRAFKHMTSPDNKQLIELFLLFRLSLFAQGNELENIVNIIQGKLKSYLTNLYQDLTDRKVSEEMILYLFSIEIVVVEHMNVEVDDVVCVHSYNSPVTGGALVHWATMSKGVFFSFIILANEIGPENRTWDMLFNCLKGREVRGKIGISHNIENLGIGNYTKKLYEYMKETPIIEKTSSWMGTVVVAHREDFIYDPEYTKEGIYRRISQLKEEERKEFLNQLFLENDSDKDSLVIFMREKHIFETTFDTFKYLYKLAADCVILNFSEETPVEEAPVEVTVNKSNLKIRIKQSEVQRLLPIVLVLENPKAIDDSMKKLLFAGIPKNKKNRNYISLHISSLEFKPALKKSLEEERQKENSVLNRLLNDFFNNSELSFLGKMFSEKPKSKIENVSDEEEQTVELIGKTASGDLLNPVKSFRHNGQ